MVRSSLENYNSQEQPVSSLSPPPPCAGSPALELHTAVAAGVLILLRCQRASGRTAVGVIGGKRQNILIDPPSGSFGPVGVVIDGRGPRLPGLFPLRGYKETSSRICKFRMSV